MRAAPACKIRGPFHSSVIAACTRCQGCLQDDVVVTIGDMEEPFCHECVMAETIARKKLASAEAEP
eukprot:12142066-Prorocentrum_lima.AAC.1